MAFVADVRGFVVLALKGQHQLFAVIVAERLHQPGDACHEEVVLRSDHQLALSGHPDEGMLSLVTADDACSSGVEPLIVSCQRVHRPPVSEEASDRSTTGVDPRGHDALALQRGDVDLLDVVLQLKNRDGHSSSLRDGPC